jgi:RluA family pseudouridine synthase
MSLISKSYNNGMLEVTHLVDLEHESMRLDQFLQLYLDSFSREFIKKKIKEHEIIIKNRPGTHKPSTLLHHKDEVTVIFKKSKFEDENWAGKALELQLEPEIVYEDNDLIVISKPAFMSTHPAGRHIFNCATVFFEIKYNQTIHSLHRIDRETSGILMLGKNPAMAQTMMKNFDDEFVKKCYLFISRKNEIYKGQLEFEAFERLASPDEGIKRVVVEAYPENSNEGKVAHTKFKILENLKTHVIGLAFPQTGRQHQIRVHAKTHGLPLIGDKLYLGSYETFQHFKDQIATSEEYELMEIPRHALHAIALKIPYKKDTKTFITKIPKDLADWIRTHTDLSVEDLEKRIALEAQNL